MRGAGEGGDGGFVGVGWVHVGESVEEAGGDVDAGCGEGVQQAQELHDPNGRSDDELVLGGL